jgi:hypothetical protein
LQAVIQGFCFKSHLLPFKETREGWTQQFLQAGLLLRSLATN